jgi:hypothetical protein
MPRFSQIIFNTTLGALYVLLSPEIEFWVQLYFLIKDSHGDVDIFVNEKHRDAIREHFKLNPSFEECPHSDKNRDKVVVTIHDYEGSDGVNVTVEFKYSQHPEESAFAGSYGGIFHILVIHSIRAMYGKNISIKDGYVVIDEGKVVVPIITLKQFLVQHNFDLHVSQAEALPTINDFFETWSKSTCFVPSAILREFERPKQRDERALRMYNAFTEWLPSKGLSKEEPVLTPEQCQQKAEEAFPEACRHLQQALDAEKMVRNAQKIASPKLIVGIIKCSPSDKTMHLQLSSFSRFLQGTNTEKDTTCTTYKECIALHDQFKAMYGGGDIFRAITETVGKEAWEEYVKGMWTVYNSTSTTTQTEGGC